MNGTKAQAVAAWAARKGRGSLRFDYFGHGASSGDFRKGTISRWRDDALAVLDAIAPGPLLLVGSSMGGWLALLVALARRPRVRALVGIAAAADFTETLMWQAMTQDERATLMRDGRLIVPSAYGEPYPLTRALIEEGRRHLLLAAPIRLACPVRLLHGQQDADVPWETALRLAERIEGTDVQVTLVKDGEHRLSRPQDLALLGRTVGALLGEDGA
jgi:pimeloyl-ACP methyl ester carboxylesterase